MKFEDEVRAWMDENDHVYEDNTRSTTKMDFTVLLSTEFYGLEVKEKGKSYNLNNWPDIGVDEGDVFILDELTFRKFVAQHGLRCVILVRDNPNSRYVLLDGATLMLMPKTQVNRDQGGYLKGKLMFDMTYGYVSDDLGKVMRATMRFFHSSKNIERQSECWSPNWEVDQGGVRRTGAHKTYDRLTYMSEGRD